ncbi:MAG: hypothetical protein HY940_02350 [Gammaproteobacteria bacterium]|nr:hypothetical protein [Gammaproteobacteria bacterium]
MSSHDSDMQAPVAGSVFRPEFEKLRHMETFTDAMFNRIVAMQQREHPAWDASRPFEERIRDLPLHALIFSNPDRDPARFAHTVAPFYPLRGELHQLAYCIRQLGEQPRVLDLHPGNGFIGSLLAREGVAVTGLRQPGGKPNQIAEFHDPFCYQFRDGTLADIGEEFDVVFSAWMPAGVNVTPQIIQRRPKLIIFIHTDHVDTASGLPQTGTPQAFRELPADYALIAEWSITRPDNLLHEVWADLTPSIEELRHVKVYAATPFHGIDVRPAPFDSGLYDWEYELDMALTALQAKQALRAQGFPV